MSNSIMEKAIGNLDDELIRDAAALKKKKKGKIISFYALSAVAACLVLVMALSVTLKSNKKPEVYFDGEVLTQSVALNSNQSPSVRSVAAMPLTIDLELKLHRKTEISVSGGSICVVEDSGATLYTEDTFKAQEDVSITWVIDSPDESKTYELNLNKETYAKVSFDKGRNVWTITGQ